MPKDRPHVSIVLATLNGQPYLAKQLLSLNAQSYSNWSLILTDDGSTDDSLTVARRLIRPERLQILKGPQQGLAQNFWNGLQRVDAGHALAFCDQDDVWHPDKLFKALNMLGDGQQPSLYTAGRRVTDAKLKTQWVQKRQAPSNFARTLWRNRAAGHTCVLNPSAVRLLQQFTPPKNIPFHDWWIALIMTGTGARLVHDPAPVLAYRQHDRNAFGARAGRMNTVLSGRYFKWMAANIEGLRHFENQLSDQARASLRQWSRRKIIR